LKKKPELKRLSSRDPRPNPFNSQTHIRYELGIAHHVSLKIYDAMGRYIKTLVDVTQPAGIYRLTFVASGYASGIYYYQLQAGSLLQSGRMIFIK